MSLKTGVVGSETVSGAEQTNDIGPKVFNILVLKCEDSRSIEEEAEMETQKEHPHETATTS
ncbi:uncharacterized protein CLUP02_09533 [Colletotrichum lupini]|uniref:Uncharacterized protein n=1 Tax=Colletotrichum lupini TaxID=145971 RepID=A0A9Q8WII3_9PEZI|nr:uncharacterized protein CLUP02_09533 [Colletotrichum lupini]UQC84037.1 hypothetical protein CLUP02_09533 [Colletotrichum lupini]